MTAATAAHLNELLQKAAPIVINDGGMGLAHPAVRGEDLAALMVRSLGRYATLATEQEIVAAATERRLASTFCPDPKVGYVDGKNMAYLPPVGFARRVWVLALPELTEAVNSSNAARAARYEQYRVACEQGVAVPPGTAAPEKKDEHFR